MIHNFYAPTKLRLGADKQDDESRGGERRSSYHSTTAVGDEPATINKIDDCKENKVDDLNGLEQGDEGNNTTAKIQVRNDLTANEDGPDITEDMERKSPLHSDEELDSMLDEVPIDDCNQGASWRESYVLLLSCPAQGDD